MAQGHRLLALPIGDLKGYTQPAQFSMTKHEAPILPSYFSRCSFLPVRRLLREQKSLQFHWLDKNTRWIEVGESLAEILFKGLLLFAQDFNGAVGGRIAITDD